MVISSVVGDVLDEAVVAGYIQEATMMAVLHPAIFKAVADNLLKIDDFMALLMKFVLHYVKKSRF